MIDLVLAESRSEKSIADEFVRKHHSYVASSRVVGRCIKYLIYEDEKLVGTTWVGSGFKPTPKDILIWLGTSQREFDRNFNTVADNKRFCMSGGSANAGSMALRALRNRVHGDWLNRYGDELVAIVTTIGGGKTGAVYLADNWERIGMTSGLPSERKSVSMKWNSPSEITERFVVPTGSNRKLILGTKRIKHQEG